MATFYDMLDMAPTANAADITKACDTKHNHWQRLVTHHDPSVAAQAQQQIQTIEMIRTTLSDPGKRQAYDASVGLGGVVGGLATRAPGTLDGNGVAPGGTPPPTSRTPNSSATACRRGFTTIAGDEPLDLPEVL